MFKITTGHRLALFEREATESLEPPKGRFLPATPGLSYFLLGTSL